MNSAVCCIVSYAVNAVWQVPLLAGTGFAVSRILRRRGPQAQHVAWVASFLIGSISPALPAFRAILPLPISQGHFPMKVGTAAVAAGGLPGLVAHGGTVLLPAGLIWPIFSLYVSTLAWFGAKFLWTIASARSLVRNGAPLKLAAGDQEIWKQVRRAFAATNVRLLSSGNLRGVVTAGARRPTIILPTDLASRCSDDDLLSALGHELAHVRRHDYAKNLLYGTVGLLTAFHPVTWMVRAQIGRTREMTCDAMVVERLVDRKRYRQSLLRLAERMMPAGRVPANVLGMFDANILEERIMMMKSKRDTPNRLVRATLTGCASILLAAAAIGGTAFAKGVAARGADHSANPTRVYEIGDGVTAPALTWAPDPKYSNRARKAHYQGICTVGLIVGIDGRPRNVRVVRTLGMGLDENAVKAVKEYRFKPGIFDGKPVPVKINVEVNFRIY